jgi:hypothetical protein
MTQALYAHMNNKKIKIKKIARVMQWTHILLLTTEGIGL